MSKRTYFLIYVGSAVFFAALSFLQKTPGYMDAAYYYSSGIQLATGKGLVEPFIWNYLSNPVSLPVPAFSYWMPMAALLSALGMVICGTTTYWAARIPFILLAGTLPILTILIARRFTQKKYLYLSAGVLALVGGYYLPYYGVTETFVPYLVLGAVFCLLAGQITEKESSPKSRYYWMLLLGVVAGLMHLTRADGILWLAGSWLVVVLLPDVKWKQRLQFLLLCTVGYLAVMAAWYLRNLSVFHSLFPAGTNLSLFFTNYNDLFVYPISQLNILHLLSNGWSSFVAIRFSAVLSNLGDLLGASGGIILFPFTIAAIWMNRKHKLVSFSLIMLGVTFIAMSFVFPFAGERGGFFHSAGALQCFFWSLTPLGIENLITRVANWRKWKVERAIKLLGTTLLAVFLLISAGILFSKTFGNGSELNPGWDQKYQNFALLDDYLVKAGALPGDVVMVNDSPGYYAMTGRSSVQMTSGSLQAAENAMDRFNVRYLLIDQGHTHAFDDLYSSPGLTEQLTLIGKYQEFVVYRVNR